MNEINLKNLDIHTISEEEIDKLIELEGLDFSETKKKHKIVVDGRKIRNESKARKGFLGMFNKAHQKDRQQAFIDNVQSGHDEGKIRIVTEGDSWFNYPTKLQEVIDHLFNDYSIFSLGYAGDWLSNIYQEQEYSTAIKLYKPDVFILSGGGNDLVGGRRLKELLNRYSKGATAKDLIRTKRLDGIMDDFKFIYTNIFDHLSKDFPDMKIICHGYDFPALEDGKERVWFGKPMRRKRINDRKLRMEIAKIMMNQFNEMMIKLIKDYPQVHFIDVRNKVPRDMWKNELHPNDDGFRVVAKLFDKKIKEIMK